MTPYNGEVSCRQQRASKIKLAQKPQGANYLRHIGCLVRQSQACHNNQLSINQPTNSDVQQQVRFLVSPQDLVWHEVTPAMGKVQFQGPECWKPLKKGPGIAAFFKKPASGKPGASS